MKKSIIIFFSLACLHAGAQTKVETKIPKDSTLKVDTTYSIHLTKEQLINLVSIIRSLDEKPSIINKWLDENIFKNLETIPVKKK